MQALRSFTVLILGRPTREISIARLLAQLFQVTDQFEMETQPQLLLLQKTILIAEGVGRYRRPQHRRSPSLTSDLAKLRLNDRDASLAGERCDPATLNWATQRLGVPVLVGRHQPAGLAQLGVGLPLLVGGELQVLDLEPDVDAFHGRPLRLRIFRIY